MKALTKLLCSANSSWQTERRLETLIHRRIEQLQRQLEALTERPVLKDPRRLLSPLSERADRAAEALTGAMERRLERERAELAHGAGRLEALSPLAVLQRGYASVRREETPVTSVQELSVGDLLTLRMSDGSIESRVTALAAEK